MIDILMNIEKTMRFAEDAHGDQKYGDQPYTIHLFEVAEIVGTIEDPVLRPGYLQIVAWLHDTVEDTDVTLPQLREEFDEFVAGAVELVTDPPGATRKDRKDALHRMLARLDKTRIDERAALLVKASDRLANARASKMLVECGDDGERAKGRRWLKMYRGEHTDFRSAVWRANLCDNVWAELDRLLAD